MRLTTQFFFAAVFVLLAMQGLAAEPASPQKRQQDQQQTKTDNQDRWRYTFHNGEWWYWLPSERWVYWRGNCWNDYDPKTYVYPSQYHSEPYYGYNGSSPYAQSPDANSYGRTGWGYGSGMGESDVKPFYGHSLSTLDRRPLERNGEVGPFYGHALPGEVFGGGGRGGYIRPFYGHALSSYGY